MGNCSPNCQCDRSDGSKANTVFVNHHSSSSSKDLNEDGNGHVRVNPLPDPMSDPLPGQPVSCSDGSVYVGQWKGSRFNGEGKLRIPDGTTYEGQFLDGRKHGVAKYCYANGAVYEGEYFEDRKQGKGRLTCPTRGSTNEGSSYEGEWFNDLQEGYGVERWGDGSVFMGEFREGKKTWPWQIHVE